MLEETEIQVFAELWQEEFGEKLSLDEARYQATLLLELYALIYQPLEDDSPHA